MSEIEFTLLKRDDYKAWRKLFTGYCEFYHESADEEKLAAVWGWIFNDEHQLLCTVARNEEGKMMGIAQYHRWPIPLFGTDIAYLSDLFVDPTYRGKGVGHALYQYVLGWAKEKGLPILSLLTSESNYKARALYDLYGEASEFRFYLTPTEVIGQLENHATQGE